MTGRAAQPPEFSLRDVVSLTWSPLLILPLSRLAALIRPFLEPNFPQRWSDSDVGVDARPGQPVGRCLILRPAPSPFPSAFLNGLLSGLPRFLPLQASKCLTITANCRASDDTFPRRPPR